MIKKIIQGVVVKSLNDKTITVNVERRFMDKKYIVHDETNKSVAGDIVKIVECRPRSRTKRFELYNKNTLKEKKWLFQKQI